MEAAGTLGFKSWHHHLKVLWSWIIVKVQPSMAMWAFKRMMPIQKILCLYSVPQKMVWIVWGVWMQQIFSPLFHQDPIPQSRPCVNFAERNPQSCLTNHIITINEFFISSLTHDTCFFSASHLPINTNWLQNNTQQEAPCFENWDTHSLSLISTTPSSLLVGLSRAIPTPGKEKGEVDLTGGGTGASVNYIHIAWMEAMIPQAWKMHSLNIATWSQFWP